MPVPTFSSMADSLRRNSLSPSRGKPVLVRVNAHKRIDYEAPSSQELDSLDRDISEEDLMVHGAEDQDAFNQIRSMVGDWSISADDYYTRKSRARVLDCDIASSPPLSPALVSPASTKRSDFTSSSSPLSSESQGSFSFNRQRGSWRSGAQAEETPVATTSYYQAAPTPRRAGIKSGELNPSWMTEGKIWDRTHNGVLESGVGNVDSSPRTSISRVPWISERLPDHEDTPAFTSSRLYTSTSVPVQSTRPKSPAAGRDSWARDISLSPPRDYPFARTASAPVESVVEETVPPDKGSVVQNEERPSEWSPVGASHATVPNNIVTRGADQSGSGSGSTDDGGSCSLGMDGDVVLSPSPTSGVPWKSWVKLQRLGAGSFGTVYLGGSNDGMYFAVKEVPLDSESEQSVTQLEQEISILSKYQHENIVQYLGTERTSDTLYIFLEYVIMGSLQSLYNKHQLFGEQIQNYTRQILHGLKYLHEQEIVHRDVKCANILVATNGTVKLADFGMAKQISKFEEVKSTKGSAQWMAPEVIDPRKKYYLPADIWSLGCTVLEMATRGPPFGQLEWGRVFWKVAHGEAPDIPDDLDENMKDFIRQCLEFNPSQRPTAAELLLHPFVSGGHSVPPSPSSSFKANSRGVLQPITEIAAEELITEKSYRKGHE